MIHYLRWTVWFALALAGCGSESPDTALARLVEDAERAAEARDTGHFRALIADAYADARGNDRARVVDRIRAYFLVNTDIDVVTRIEEIERFGDDAARIVVFVGALGRRAGQGVLPGIDGRAYRLELELVATGGDWKIIGATWDRALDAQLTGG